MKTCIVSREGDDSLTDEDLQKHLVVESLCELMKEELENGAAKKFEAGPDDASYQGAEDSNDAGGEHRETGEESAEDVSE